MSAHIVRLDKPKHSKKGTHGWQVRVGGKRGYHSRLFSDGMYGSRGQALIAAEEYLAKYAAEHPELATSRKNPQHPHGFQDGQINANNKSGVRGVSRTHQYGRWDVNKERKHYYWAASYTIDKYGHQHINRHKKFEVDEYGEEEARRRAIEFRLMWEDAARQGVEAVVAFFEAYEEGWLAED